MQTNNHKYVKQRRKPKRVMLKSHEPNIPRWSSELKAVDTNITSNFSASGVWTKITYPNQGLTYQDRIADRCRIVGLEFIGQMNTSVLDVARIIVIQVKGLQTSPPATSDLLVSSYPTVPYVYNCNELFEILYDHTHSMTPNGDSNIVALHTMIKPKIPELRFISGSSNVYSGQMYILVLGIGNTIARNFTFRLWFEDSN